MFYYPKISNLLEILTDDEVNDFAAIIFGYIFWSIREKLFSRLREKQNYRKVAELFCLFLTTPDKLQKYLKSMHSSFSKNCICHKNIEILNTFDPEL